MANGMEWLKLYHAMLHNPKIASLDDAEFRVLLTCWCLGSASSERGVILNPEWHSIVRISGAHPASNETAEDFEKRLASVLISSHVRRSSASSERLPSVSHASSKRLLVRRSDGALVIHDWEEWQGPSKTLRSERNRRYRENQRKLRDAADQSKALRRPPRDGGETLGTVSRDATEVDLRLRDKTKNPLFISPTNGDAAEDGEREGDGFSPASIGDPDTLESQIPLCVDAFARRLPEAERALGLAPPTRISAMTRYRLTEIAKLIKDHDPSQWRLRADNAARSRQNRPTSDCATLCWLGDLERAASRFDHLAASPLFEGSSTNDSTVSADVQQARAQYEREEHERRNGAGRGGAGGS